MTWVWFIDEPRFRLRVCSSPRQLQRSLVTRVSCSVLPSHVKDPLSGYVTVVSIKGLWVMTDLFEPTSYKFRANLTPPYGHDPEEAVRAAQSQAFRVDPTYTHFFEERYIH